MYPITIYKLLKCNDIDRSDKEISLDLHKRLLMAVVSCKGFSFQFRKGRLHTIYEQQVKLFIKGSLMDN